MSLELSARIAADWGGGMSADEFADALAALNSALEVLDTSGALLVVSTQRNADLDADLDVVDLDDVDS